MHADKWGPIGSIFAALCCLGFAPALTALSAVGLRFLINDMVLIPLLVLFLGATIWGLHRDRARHQTPGPEYLAWVASVLTVGGLWISSAVVGAGLTLLIAVSVWNVLALRNTRSNQA
jgi:mercuric ion transport protein